jgi:hypothetical protein
VYLHTDLRAAIARVKRHFPRLRRSSGHPRASGRPPQRDSQKRAERHASDAPPPVSSPSTVGHRRARLGVRFVVSQSLGRDHPDRLESALGLRHLVSSAGTDLRVPGRRARCVLTQSDRPFDWSDARRSRAIGYLERGHREPTPTARLRSRLGPRFAVFAQTVPRAPCRGRPAGLRVTGGQSLRQRRRGNRHEGAEAGRDLPCWYRTMADVIALLPHFLEIIYSTHRQHSAAAHGDGSGAPSDELPEKKPLGRCSRRLRPPALQSCARSASAIKHLRSRTGPGSARSSSLPSSSSCQLGAVQPATCSRLGERAIHGTG